MLRKLQRYSFQEHPDLALTLLKVESKLEEMEAEKRIKRSHQSSILECLTVDDKEKNCLFYELAFFRLNL
ncbi:hypothetical protein T4B_6125 [Trichinella pseudospiralis]|uniref:Uncharacterized protein n=1 Tax=Trichinella pseudospiralis TaxID=6337 RepID=A0A0V1HU85_TRIPS|nr:hypothetical protein T4B_6125 [Trichinella pseudospiralis]